MTCNLIILVSHKNASVILSSFNWSVDAAAFDNPGWTMWIMYSVLYTLLTFSLMIDSWFSVPNSYLFLAFVVPLRNIRPIICSGLEWSQLTHFCACPLTAYKSLIRAPGWSSCENFRWNNSTLTTLLMSSTLIAITSAISPALSSSNIIRPVILYGLSGREWLLPRQRRFLFLSGKLMYWQYLLSFESLL